MQQSTGDEMSVAPDSDVDCVWEATEEVDDSEQDLEQENGHKIFVLVRQLSIQVSSKCLNREAYKRTTRMTLRAIGTLRVSGMSWMMSWNPKLERHHVWQHQQNVNFT